VRAPSAIHEGIVGEWRGARRRALPYETNAHFYRLTAARLAQSKNMPSFSDWVGCLTEIPLAQRPGGSNTIALLKHVPVGH
jgi:hypothetical protein